MALNPIDETHALQIQAGVLGRKAGHKFEDTITKQINELLYPIEVPQANDGHLFAGNPEVSLLHYLGVYQNVKKIVRASALSTGALATSEEGKQWLSINGVPVSRCKSDLIITIFADDGREITTGISTKQCNTKTPTNAQLYFTTARGFASVLITNGISVSDSAIRAMRQFCGDAGFRPSDTTSTDGSHRLIDPRRYFWEEVDVEGRAEWEQLFSSQQDALSRVLLQTAYVNDAFIPDYLLHKTKRSDTWKNTEVAIYSIDELIALSHAYGGFSTKPYSVNKGTYKDPKGITHLAPRFGVIQMQRGGQRQHPEQLQFNLQAGYFYKI